MRIRWDLHNAAARRLSWPACVARSRLEIVPRETGLRPATPELPGRSTWNIFPSQMPGPVRPSVPRPQIWHPRLPYLGKPDDWTRWDTQLVDRGRGSRETL